MNFILLLFFCCSYGLYPRHSECPGGPDCWCPWDTAREYQPPLDENGRIICDTGEEDSDEEG